MFTFGFSNDKGNNQKRCDTESIDTLQWKPAEELKLNIECTRLVDDSPLHIKLKDCNLLYTNPAIAVKDLLTGSEISESERQHSDLIPAIYEGGFKIWECTQDLATYLEDEIKTGNIDFNGKIVLDLGCGQGLLGILALLNGASVHFQDYNSAVLSTVTTQNIIKNFQNEDWKEIIGLCRFFSGDWGSFLELAKENGIKYDFILTSETIYNPQNYKKLFSLFKNSLHFDGSVYLATKVYYFGVGGSIRQFESMLNEEDTMITSVCWKCLEGVQREILKITFKETGDSRMFGEETIRAE